MKTVLNKMKTYLLGTIVVAVLIGSAGWNGCVAAESFPTVVTTKLGQLQGFYNSQGTVAWYSVPFAKPPVGNLRWRAPQPLEPWDGVRDATDMCEPCMQKGSMPIDDYVAMTESLVEGNIEESAFGSEDCLYLNIYRPKTMAQNLPVYVFLHGGANIGGGIAGFDGSMLAEKGNMIVVFIQYRVGPLGFFSHPVLRNGRSLADDSGSFGTLDNIQALKWIQENISAFGGNPHNVTAAGESAGGLNVMCLLISPMANGLFHRAMVQSSGFLPFTREDAESVSNHMIELFLKNDGYNRAAWDSWSDVEKEAYLRAVNAKDLIEICTDNMLSIQPIQSPGVVPGNIFAKLRTGNYNKVPIILGTNKYEYKIFLGNPMLQPILGMPSLANLLPVLNGEKSMDDVFFDPFEKELYEMSADYGSRFWRFQGVDNRAQAMKKHQDAIYAYRFDWCGPEHFNFAMGAAHSMEVFLFLGFDRGPFSAWTPEKDSFGRGELRDIMMSYVANFAATGNPNGENVPVWQAWSNDINGPKVVLLDANEDEATIEMSYEELHIRDIKVELRNKIAEWPQMKQIQYGLVPYIFPMAFQQLQPEQIVMDFGIFGEYGFNTGYLMRKMMYSDMLFETMNTLMGVVQP